MLVILVLLWPLLLAAALFTAWRPSAWRWAPSAPVPALLAAFWPGGHWEAPWLLLGLRLGVDPLGAPLLLLAAVVWLLAALAARRAMAGDAHRDRFLALFLLTMAGNLGVFIALDAAGFYLAYALMTFAAYGLVIHDGRAVSRRAGRVYLVLAVLGEGLLVAGLLLMAAEFGNPDLRGLGPMLAGAAHKDWLVVLFLLGFGIKMGMVPLHLWLPLAHPCAPVPASAVLSGVIVKAGLMGWLRFLPLGQGVTDAVAPWVMAIGLFSAFFAVVVGLAQERAKTVLAYSTVSQMGLLTLLIGLGLALPEIQWTLAMGAVVLMALHHGLAKGALFLAMGADARARFWLMLWPAAALAGLPLTAGALGKKALKDAVDMAPGVWAELLLPLLALSSLATTLLMLRLLWLVRPPGGPWGAEHNGAVGEPARGRAPVLGLVLIGVFLPWLWAGWQLPQAAVAALGVTALWDSLWPALLGLGAGGAWWYWAPRRWQAVRLPEGDLAALLPAAPSLPQPPAWQPLLSDSGGGSRLVSRMASGFSQLAVAGALFLALVLLMLLLLLR
ncbi:complex I subunit 5 family protein [Alkalilimnicola ehrlichii MLHE-1]|uniref:NADH/Ubiquinone/plastoquinone (Complex I) n=1 Tax=Alkalilimnicola ehrlichii (strain ATCC BAA-1101 / DSM 17681 / MLHE-1) TaxID=187272 RepID=Q0A9W1_ALKEH|nr:complex I subunit 5 family protein [Alkalilimnicola ehrlichii]ABI56376.1 NADH/Ubiquinone/plastoquinone (complex I) [Alkalilimnicola ehrlichii MLHE-1]